MTGLFRTRYIKILDVKIKIQNLCLADRELTLVSGDSQATLWERRRKTKPLGIPGGPYLASYSPRKCAQPERPFSVAVAE